MFIANGHECIDLIRKDIERITGESMELIIYIKYDERREKIPYVNYPMLDALSQYMSKSERAHQLFTLFDTDPKVTISRYVTSPYADAKPAK